MQKTKYTLFFGAREQNNDIYLMVSQFVTVKPKFDFRRFKRTATSPSLESHQLIVSNTFVIDHKGIFFF